MVQFRPQAREIIAKVVYYGPPLGGKTTNLRTLYRGYPPETRGELVIVPTGTDRTIFFDFLPVNAGTLRGMSLRIQLYTVPGQVHFNTTRQVVLRGVDGVVFVADSQREMVSANRSSWENLKENLLLQGIALADMPHVLQYNKRDLPDIVSLEELNDAVNEYNAPFYDAVATDGIGVEETLHGVVRLVARSLRERFKLAPEGPGTRDNVFIGPRLARPADSFQPSGFAEPTARAPSEELPRTPLAEPSSPPDSGVTRPVSVAPFQLERPGFGPSVEEYVTGEVAEGETPFEPEIEAPLAEDEFVVDVDLGRGVGEELRDEEVEPGGVGDALAPSAEAEWEWREDAATAEAEGESRERYEDLPPPPDAGERWAEMRAAAEEPRSLEPEVGASEPEVQPPEEEIPAFEPESPGAEAEEPGSEAEGPGAEAEEPGSEPTWGGGDEASAGGFQPPVAAPDPWSVPLVGPGSAEYGVSVMPPGAPAPEEHFTPVSRGEGALSGPDPFAPPSHFAIQREPVALLEDLGEPFGSADLGVTVETADVFAVELPPEPEEEPPLPEEEPAAFAAETEPEEDQAYFGAETEPEADSFPPTAGEEPGEAPEEVATLATAATEEAVPPTGEEPAAPLSPVAFQVGVERTVEEPSEAEAILAEEAGEEPPDVLGGGPAAAESAIQRVLPRALAQFGEVRELEVEVPVPAAWLGGRRMTLQLRVTLVPEEEQHAG